MDYFFPEFALDANGRYEFLFLDVWDEDPMKYDDHLGRLSINLASLIQQSMHKHFFIIILLLTIFLINSDRKN